MLTSQALLLRAVAYGEADVMATLFTQQQGLITLAAKGARKSKRRYTCLEPLHTLSIAYDLRHGAEVGTLYDASVAVVRVGVSTSLAKLAVAGAALGWLHSVAKPHQPIPGAWTVANAFLDALAAHGEAPNEACLDTWLAAYGIHLLVTVGLDPRFDSCCQCDKVCPDSGAVTVDPAQGGVVCRNCGGGPILLGGALRERIVATCEGVNALVDGDAPAVVRLVKAMMRDHG